LDFLCKPEIDSFPIYDLHRLINYVIFCYKEGEPLQREKQMFGNFATFPGAAGTDFGEQLINTIASQSIRRLFSSSEAVDLSIQCCPSSKLLQGNVDSVKMNGRNLVIRNQFEVSEMSFETDAIALDLTSVLRGKIHLKQSTQAIAQVKLSEAGINRAFQEELVKKRLTEVSIAGADAETLTFSDIKIQLSSGNRIELHAMAHETRSGDAAIAIPITLSAVVSVERRRRLVFEQIQPLVESIATEQQETATRFIHAFADVLNNMVDLERFDLDGIDMRMNRVEIHDQSLVLSGYAQINYFPGMGEKG
jgi:hypothetical protein